MTVPKGMRGTRPGLTRLDQRSTAERDTPGPFAFQLIGCALFWSSASEFAPAFNSTA